MQRAIVLAGGGARGSYEFGAWTALRELGVSYQMAVGTSIGAINAALMAQDDYDLAGEIWDTITVQNIMQDGINLGADLGAYYNQRKDVKQFLKRFKDNRGADITPLVELVRGAVSEKKVRDSEIDVGLVTVRFPSFTPLELMKAQIPDGLLVDYLLASAAFYPAFPVYRIGDEGFVDGGYYDSLPINLALRSGAREVVAIDLEYKPSHPALLDRPFVLYVHPSRPLGSYLNFERGSLDRNRRMGYFDTLRAYGQVLGQRYNFDRADACAHANTARDFSIAISRYDAEVAFKSAFTRGVARTPLADTLRKGLPRRAGSTSLDEWLVAAECLLDRFDADPIARYKPSEMAALVWNGVPYPEAVETANTLSRRELAGVAAFATHFDRRLLIAALSVLLRRGTPDAITLRLLTLFPEELLAACFLLTVDSGH